MAARAAAGQHPPLVGRHRRHGQEAAAGQHPLRAGLDVDQDDVGVRPVARRDRAHVVAGAGPVPGEHGGPRVLPRHQPRLAAVGADDVQFRADRPARADQVRQPRAVGRPGDGDDLLRRGRRGPAAAWRPSRPPAAPPAAGCRSGRSRRRRGPRPARAPGTRRRRRRRSPRRPAAPRRAGRHRCRRARHVGGRHGVNSGLATAPPRLERRPGSGCAQRPAGGSHAGECGPARTSGGRAACTGRRPTRPTCHSAVACCAQMSAATTPATPGVPAGRPAPRR